MSLFKVCTLWQAQCSDYQFNYDAQLLHNCRFGFDESEKDYIVVGSHSGYLSIFKPNAIGDSSESFIGFSPSDQLFEMKLMYPIIQLSSGKFVISSNTSGIHQLAVLHPMRLSVYSLERTEGLTEHGNQFKLNLCFEHRFNKSAFAMCHGFFGGYKAREFFCITHVDCTLSLFEQDGINYEMKLEGDRHIPSKMIYNARTDSFLMVSSFCDLECYRYQDLSESADSKQKIISPAWSICIGEYPLDIQIQQISESECVVLILCENVLYGITDQANVKLMKRLDYSPICFCSFVSGWYYESDVKLMTTVISDSGSILIYNFADLVWAAQLPDVPVAVVRSNLNCLAGAIVTLSQKGVISVSYLGAEPQLFQVPPLNLQKLNFEKTQAELIDLEREIKLGIDFTDAAMINASVERDLIIQLDTATVMEPSKFQIQLVDTFVPVTDELKMVLVNVSLHFRSDLDHVQLQFHVEKPLICSKMNQSFRDVRADSKEYVETWVFMSSNTDPVSTRLTAIVSFINKRSIPRVVERHVHLPLSMFYVLSKPQKDAQIKFTISIDKPVAPSIGQLFGDDFALEANSHGAIGFQSIYTGHIATLVVSKNSNRYRLQSDQLSMLAVILETIVYRLQSMFRAQEVKLMALPQLPISSLLNLIENHFIAQANLRDSREKLHQSSTLLRMLERRFFTKLDNKKSDSIESVLIFIKDTHQQIIERIRSVENAKQALYRAQATLSAALSSFTQMIQLFEGQSKVAGHLIAALVNSINDGKMQNWEESTALAFDVLNLIGPLSKNKYSTKEDISNIDVSSFEFQRFQRHIQSVLERICRLTASTCSFATSDLSERYLDETLEEEENNETVIATEESALPQNKLEEESDWVYDVQKTMDLLPRL